MKHSESRNRVGVMFGLALLAPALAAHGQERIQSPRGQEVFGSLISLPQRVVSIGWDYPVTLETPDLVFKLYASTDLSLPFAEWELVTNIPGSLRSVFVPAEEQQEFFIMTASNFLGESDFARE